MSDPTKISDEQRAMEVLREQAEEISRLERSLAQQYGQEAQSIGKIDEHLVPREKLFSRRVLFGWAFGALIVVFVVRMVLPVVFDNVKESVVSKLGGPVRNTTVQPVVAPTPPTPPIVIPAPGTPAPTVPSANPAAPEAVKIHIKKITR
ncbi:MAG: hypothetical protein ABI718_18900 [Acidobacteriota bacterium]